MANRFPIEITGRDEGITDLIKRVNQSLEKLQAPAKRFNEQVQRLGKLGGFNQMRRSVSDIGRSFRNIVAPLGVIVGGGTVAGLAALTVEWGRFQYQAQQTAITLGMSVQSLQGLQAAAVLGGSSAAEMTGSLKTLGDTIEDATYGRNMGALVLMRAFGMEMHRTAGGAVDTGRALKDLSGILSRIRSPQVQGLLARQFGVESILPLLRRGPAAIDAYIARAEQLHAILSPKEEAQAESFGESLNTLQLAAQGLRNEIAVHLAPGMQKFTTHLTSWIQANQVRIGQFFERLGTWLGNLDFDKIARAATGFLDKLNHIVDALGGFKTIALALGGVMVANLLAPFASLAASLVLMAPALAAAWPVLAAFAAIAGVGAGVWTVRNFAQNHPNGISTSGHAGDNTIGRAQNNPLNLRSWGGFPQINGFASFPDQQTGIAAAAMQLQLYGGRGKDTIRDIVSTWAPPSENDTEGYIRAVAKQMDTDPEQHLNLKDPAVMKSLVGAMAIREGNPVDSDVLARAIAGAMGERPHKLVMTFSGLPDGVSLSASAPGGVGYSMAGGP